MLFADMTVGLRVKTVQVIDIYPLGVFPVDLTGTVTATDGTMADVTLDQHFDVLDNWDNAIQVWCGERADEGTDASIFEPI